MSTVHFRCVLPDGWAENVRVQIFDGHFTKVERGVGAGTGDERVDIGLPGLCNVHSHGFQRGMAGLTEYRGPDADNFWSWRECMYRFVSRMLPEDIEAITAMAYVEMLEGGFTRVGEFHCVHHDPWVAVREPRRDGSTPSRAAAEVTGITLLPQFYARQLWGGTCARAEAFYDEPRRAWRDCSRRVDWQYYAGGCRLKGHAARRGAR
jgi:cytosine/adenosine deaminase-related metal-dependent hydrolase